MISLAHILRIAVILLTVGIGSHCARAERERELSEYPEMAPERCAELPPEELYEKYLKLDLPRITSESGHDYFCSTYQRQLQKFTDARFPRGKSYRKELHAAFASMMEYVEVVWRPFGKLGHDDQRLGAWGEWVILQAEKNHYMRPDGTGSTAAGVERYAIEVAGRLNRTRPSFDEEALPFLHDAIRHLMRATEEEGEVRQLPRTYFGRALEEFLARYDKPIPTVEATGSAGKTPAEAGVRANSAGGTP